MKKVLVGIEISKKQAYIFKSDRLKEIIGASRIIRFITETLAESYSDQFDGEKYYSGGGSSYYKFKNEKGARYFIQELSLKVYECFPEIELFFGLSKKGDGIEVRQKLQHAKQRRILSFKRVSFGLEEICENSGTPAIMKNDDEKKTSKMRFVSQDTYAKLVFAKSEEDQLRKLLEPYFLWCEKAQQFFTDEMKNDDELTDFDEITESDEKHSFMAVVSLDGNRMGEMVAKVKDDSAKIKAFSDEIDQTYKKAYENMKRQLFSNKTTTKEKDIRKLVLAGDDMTYVIQSDKAIESVQIVLEKINQRLKSIPNETLSACAGIVFVRKKYPISVAVKLADAIVSDCKAHLQKNDWKNESIFSYQVSKGENKIHTPLFVAVSKPLTGMVDGKDLNKWLDEEKDEERYGKLLESVISNFSEAAFKEFLNKHQLKRGFEELVAQFYDESAEGIITKENYNRVRKLLELRRFNEKVERRKRGD